MERPPPRGLTSADARTLLEQHGPNAIPETAPTPLWRRFVRQFKSPLIYMLLFALAFDLVIWFRGGHGVPVEAVAIGAVLLLNSVLGTFQEFRSEQALAQLKALAAPSAWVLRDGALARVAAHEIVPGDVVRVEAGERVPADGVFRESHGVLIDEAVLTGESVAVDKAADDEGSSGTLVVRGKGLLEVLRTGPASAMGKLATSLGAIETEATPLDKRIAALGTQLARGIGALTVLLAVAGVAVEGVGRFGEVVLFAVALAVAAVPEGLPAVVTMTLALGVKRMARRHAVVRRLSAVEALGSVTVICTDKTGTLTENRMAVKDLVVDGGDEEQALRAIVIANDADPDGRVGDPLEIGLLEYARTRGVDVLATRTAHRRVSARPFDSAWKFMRVTVATSAGPRAWLKGAPEVILARAHLSDEQRTHWLARAEEGAGRGMRVLALASAPGEAEDDVTMLGLVMLWDPPRPEVADAIARAQDAGIRVIMITGDHPGTAKGLAHVVGLANTDVLAGPVIESMTMEALSTACATTGVYARAKPEHKLRIVDALKASGEIVAMTGDGVNDAPALKRSDVGIAMGQRGSDVAREVSDLVLLDDNFATIIGAVEEGRAIYENIQAFLRFTLSANVALVAIVVAGAVGSFAEGLRDTSGLLMLPLTALQLLWINFLGDGPPALALGFDRHPDVMKRAPRPAKSGLLDTASLRFVFIHGGFMGALGIGLLVALRPLGYALLAIQTAMFLYASIGKLVTAYPARTLKENPSTNLVLHAAVAAGIAIQLLAVSAPALRSVLGLDAIDARLLAVTVGAVASTFLVGVASVVLARRGKG